MNKIYKLVWSKVRNTWVVASEIAKSHGKSSSRRKKTMAALMVFSLLSAGGLTYAEPILTPDQQAVYDAVLQKLETEKKTAHYFSVNSGEPANPAGTNWNNDGATGKDAVAIGNSAKAIGGSSTALGYNSQAKGEFSTAFGYEAKAIGGTSTALGYDSQAEGGYSTALGSAAKAKGKKSTALGYLSQAEGESSTALGYLSKAEGGYSTALGFVSKAEGESSTALGYKAQAQRNDSTALGNQAKAEGESSTALGAEAQATGENSTAFGYEAKAQASDSVAIGTQSVADREAGEVGYLASAGGTTLDDVLTALNKKADYDNWTATINASKAEYDRLTNAYFNASVIDKAAAKAALDTWKGQHQDFVDALEARARLETIWKASKGAVSVGGERLDEAGNRVIETRQITNVAAGTNDTDAVNVAQLKLMDKKVDKNAADITTINENITKMAGKATKVTVDDKDDNRDDADASLKITKKTVDGQTTYNLSLNDKITIGKDGKDGKIGINGKDGKSADITVGKGKDGVDGTNGQDGITRIIYTEKDGQNTKIHEVATLDDGLKFKGDNDSVVIRKLNSQMDIKGGAAAADLSENNIGVVGTADADGQVGNLTVKLSKKLTGLTSAQFVDGDNITNITGGNISITKKVDGNKTTKNIDLWNLSTTVEGNKTNISNLTTTVKNFKGGFTLKDANNGTANIALGETTKPAITFKAETENTEGATSALTATVDDQKNVTYKLNIKKLKEEMALTQGTGSMSSWKLKATGGTAETIADGNEVEFAVEEANKGLTVKQVGKKIQYGINADKLVENINSATTKITNVDGDNIDLSKNTSIKTINENITKMAGKATKVTVDDKDDNRDDADASLKITKETVDGQTTYNLSLNDKITIGKDGKDGKIGINGKDGKSADITVGKGKDGVDGTNGQDGITRIIYTDKNTKTHEVATLDDGLKFKGDNNDVVIRKLNTQLNITGGATAADLSDGNIGVVGTTGDNGGLAVKLSKKLTGLTSAQFVDGDNITNITGGNISITKKVEGNKTTKNIDLWELNETVNNITAGTTGGSWKLQANGANERTIKKDSIVNFKNGTNTEVTVNGNDITVDLNEATKKQITDNTTKIDEIGGKITNIENKVNNIETNIDTKIEQKIEGAKITVDGDKDTGVKAEPVKTGNKVTGYKVSLDNKVKVGNVAIDGKDGKGEITGLTNKDWDGENIVSGRAATEDQLQKAIGKVQKQSFTTVKGKGNITVTPETEGASKYTVELAKDISVDSVTAKEYKVGDKTYINDKGINANKNKITNVADGVVSKDSKDAVNGSQLFATNRQVLNNMNQINNLREESREGDALGAAMAALKPLDFDPYQRSQVMAGVGYYRGKEAVALGLAHYKNEDLMFHGGLAYAGNSNLMANVGVSYRFGSSEDKEAKKARNLRMPQYDKGPISSVYILQDEVQSLKRENDAIRKENEEAREQIRNADKKVEEVRREANEKIAALEAKLEQVLKNVK